jgi:hypothetical protein
MWWPKLMQFLAPCRLFSHVEVEALIVMAAFRLEVKWKA